MPDNIKVQKVKSVGVTCKSVGVTCKCDDETFVRVWETYASKGRRLIADALGMAVASINARYKKLTSCGVRLSEPAKIQRIVDVKKLNQLAEQTRQLAEQPAATPIIKNLTPHAITLYQHGPARWGYQTVIQPSGAVADVETVPGRLLDTTLPVEEVWSPIAFGEVVGLPPPEKGVVLLVSHKVASAAKRADVYSPPLAFASYRYNDGTVRNKKGEIVGVTRLVRSL